LLAAKKKAVVVSFRLPWVPEDIFFLSILMVRDEAGLTVNEEKNNLWSQEYDWILPCPQGINNIIKALIGYIEQLDMGVSNR